jgi:hypothetical protein
MAYNFRTYDTETLFLMPPSLDEWVSEGSLVRFVNDVIDHLADENQFEPPRVCERP